MDLAKHVNMLLNSETDWPMWEWKIRDLLDYREGALDVADGKKIMDMETELMVFGKH